WAGGLELLARRAADLTASGREALVYPLDVTDTVAVRAMVDDIGARWGGIDVLVNNAGRGLSATFEDTKPEELRELLELNVMAVFTATQAVLPGMRARGRGHVINVSSIVGQRGVPYRSAYSATKFALGGLSEALRVELAGTGIQVSLVYPIGTATEFHEVESRRGGAGAAGAVPAAARGAGPAGPDPFLGACRALYPSLRQVPARGDLSLQAVLAARGGERARAAPRRPGNATAVSLSCPEGASARREAPHDPFSAPLRHHDVFT